MADRRAAGRRVAAEDLVAFAATAEVAAAVGWRYTVVMGWKPYVSTTVDTLSSQRRRLSDRLGMVDALMTGVADGPRPLGELGAQTVAPAVARGLPAAPRPAPVSTDGFNESDRLQPAYQKILERNLGVGVGSGQGDLAAAIGELKAKPAGELQVHGSGALSR